ncbi:hypothetical protein QBC39DRAFT_290088 [Podospora conica]|nr:hypothetical protein QBC39DRAFT_290088 [Schizothecium conicum]
MFAARKLATHRQLKIYAASLCGLIAIFVFFHWTRWLCRRADRSMKRGHGSLFGRPFVRGSRMIRNILIRKIPGFKSAGHALLITTFVAINLTITFTNLDTSSNTTIASRFAWMALANLVFVIFLALKNTPLAFLTAYSYERLNCLHQIAGLMVFGYIVVHASLYTDYFNSSGRLATKYSDRNMIAAIVAGFSVLSGIFSALVLRRIWYELFYVVHIASWMSALVAIGLHQPDFGKGLILTVLAGSLWSADRLLRAGRIAMHAVNNSATLHPLPNGGTKIVLKKAPSRAAAGKHCFVWIPAIRRFETHPFTIHGTGPVEFTVKAQDGFTRDLHKYATENPGVAVRASVDGPYGTFPDPMEFDKVVLIAGGGGATFTFGLAVNVLERLGGDGEAAGKKIVFVWAVQKHENLSWFKSQLDLLKSHAHAQHIDISLYVTQAVAQDATAPSSSSQYSLNDSSASSPTSPTDGEKAASSFPPPMTEKDLETAVIETHHKEAPMTTTSTSTTEHGREVKQGRPDVAGLIRAAIETTPANQRVLVAACGPAGLMRTVRNTSAQGIRGGGAGVEVHLEEFGW